MLAHVEESRTWLMTDGHNMVNLHYEPINEKFKWFVFNLQLILDTGQWIELGVEERHQFRTTEWFDGQPEFDYHLECFVMQYANAVVMWDENGMSIKTTSGQVVPCKQVDPPR